MTDKTHPPHILIVDDEWMTREVMQTFLTSAGYRVSAASDGEGALAIAFADPPALVLLDVWMPTIDGYETCERLKNDPRTQDAIVWMITAMQDAENQRRALEAGADGFVAKPFEWATILSNIKALLQHGA